MATPFLSSEEYDERAHRLYDEGDYDGAIEMLKEGLVLYPHAVDLYVGLGYTRLAREEYAWARQAFAQALALEPDNEDALVGAGEALFRLGRDEEALKHFDRVWRNGAADDLDLLLSMGRTLYRERYYAEAREAFDRAVELFPESADAVAALAYTVHRQGDEDESKRLLRRALELDPALYEARIYLGHLLYDQGEWEGALREFESVPPAEHWDPVALWRLIELRRTLGALEPGAPALAVWEERQRDLAENVDPIDELLAEIEQRVAEQHHAPPPAAIEGNALIHRIRTPDGQVFVGSWSDIVRQLRDATGLPNESVAQFMRRKAAEQRARTGIGIPTDDPEAFIRASARAGLLRIEC